MEMGEFMFPYVSAPVPVKSKIAEPSWGFMVIVIQTGVPSS